MARLTVAFLLASLLGGTVADNAAAQEPNDLPEAIKQELREVLPPGIKPPLVGFAPSMSIVVERMLSLAEVTKDDFVLDLGSGDGRIPIAAARARGARGLGIEIVPALVKRAKEKAKAAGVDNLVEFREADLFKTSIQDASVVMLYLPVAVNNLLRPRFLNELTPGTRIVAHEFPMTEWPADIVERINHRTIYLWIVPARVAGEWRVESQGKSFTISLSQDHQVVRGTAKIDGRAQPLKDIRLRGEAFDFAVELENGRYTHFHGRVAGGRIEPRDGASSPLTQTWHAARLKTGEEAGQ